MTDNTGKYTKIPNDILDAMPTLGNAELRVLLAIARKTVGWQKECDVISSRQLAAITGLTLRNTHTAIQSLVKRGLIDQERAGKQSFCYRLKPLPVGVQLDCTPSDTGTLGDTAPLPVGIQSDEKLYPLGYQQKKESKEKKEMDVAVRKKRTRTAPEDTTPVIIRTTLADVCGFDLSVCSREKHLQVNTTAKRLYENGEKAGKSAEEIAETIRYVAGYYAKNDWRGKRGDRPAPKDLVDIWGAAIAARTKNGSAGPAPYQPRNHKPTDTKRLAELRAKARESGK